MDHATLASAITGLFGLGIGFPTGLLTRSGKIAQLRESIETHKANLVAKDEHISDLTGEVTQLGTRCSELRAEGRKKDDQIADLKPHAERYREQAAQRQAALSKAREANAARAAGKASNVTPITTPKKPSRKSAAAG